MERERRRQAAEADEHAKMRAAEDSARRAEAERRRAEAERRAAEEERERAEQVRREPPSEREAAAAAVEAAARANLFSSEPAEEEYKGARDEKSVERDLAVRQILSKNSRNVRAAVGLKLSSPEAEVRKRVRHLLRLLHPDFTINLPLKGTKQHARIETAFKKLNELREQLER